MKIKKYVSIAVLASMCVWGLVACNQPHGNAVAAADKAKIEGIVHDYILQNPEIILQAVQNLQQKQVDQARKSVQKTRDMAPKFAAELFGQSNDPFIGNPNAKITLVEFFDYQCPHCVAMVPVMDALIKANPDLRVVFKEFPIRGSVSEYAARVALVANAEGKYFAFHKALMNGNEHLTKEAVLKVAKQVGLDPEKVKKDIESDAIKNKVQANVKLGQSLELIGTPAFFIAKTDVVTVPSGIEFTPGQSEQGPLQDLVNKVAKE